MDKSRKKPVTSTIMAVRVDGKDGLSTIKTVYVDKRQKKRLPSTKRLSFVDGKESDCMQYQKKKGDNLKQS